MTTTTDEEAPAPDLNFERIPSADEAIAYRLLISEIRRQADAAAEAAAALGDLADTWHGTDLFLPEVAEDGEDALAPGAASIPAGRDAAALLQLRLREVTHQAYAIGGHYQRVARRLRADLAAELRTPYLAFKILASDELGDLAYVKDTDEWIDVRTRTSLGHRGSPLQLTAYRLQQAGLLKAFDHHFAHTAEA